MDNIWINNRYLISLQQVFSVSRSLPLALIMMIDASEANMEDIFSLVKFKLMF
jgi:hypothetical protein